MIAGRRSKRVDQNDAERLMVIVGDGDDVAEQVEDQQDAGQGQRHQDDARQELPQQVTDDDVCVS